MASLSAAYLEGGVNAVIMPGTIIAFPSDFVPPGWALCNGAAYNVSQNPILHEVLGFSGVLPNLNAAFLRGSGTASNPNYVAGSVRTTQTDGFKWHTHPVSETPHTHPIVVPNSVRADFGSRTGGFTVTRQTSTNTTGVTVNSTGDAETRPFCYGIYYIIKLDPTGS